MTTRIVVSTGLVAIVVSFGTAACVLDEEPSSVTVDNPTLALGAQVYGQHCASCHGVDLRGTEKGPSHLSIVYEPNHHPDDAFRSAIANGVPQHHWTFGDMAPIAGLSDEEVEAVIGFVRSEQQRLGFEQ